MQFVSLGPFTLNVYTLLIALAALGSLGVAWWQTRGILSLSKDIVFAALIIAVLALAFARLGYVALNIDYFREHANEIVSLTGLSEHAAIVGACVGCWLLAKRVPLPTFSILNFQFSISAAASLGCIPNGCAFGRAVFWQTDGAASLAWLLRADWPDAFGVNNPRWPTQALMAAWLLVMFVLVCAWVRNSRVGAQFAHGRANHTTHFTLSFAFGDFALQFLRGDSAFMFASLRIYQWFDLALIGIGLAILIVKSKQVSA